MSTKFPSSTEEDTFSVSSGLGEEPPNSNPEDTVATQES